MTYEIRAWDGRSQALTNIVDLWLRSVSETGTRTRATYEDYIHAFRRQLQEGGYDLDGQETRAREPASQDEVVALLSLAAQAWAARSTRRQSVGASTYNQRLSVLSSFYQFARKRRLLMIDNPIDLLDRRKVQEYAHALPMDKEEVLRILNMIDKTVLAGKRDYALLLIFISTGRRAHEMLRMQWRDVHINGAKITIQFHCKGNKEMSDQLEPRAARAFLTYVHAMFQQDLARLEPEQYIWLSLSMKNFKQPLTQRGLADIFQKRLGTMKIHTTRHTFAHNSAKSGASVIDIQQRLGHSNPAITGRYLQSLNRAENEHVSDLLDFLGIEE